MVSSRCKNPVVVGTRSSQFAAPKKGVRARLVDKDFAPKWDQKRLEEVTSDMVDRFFNPLDELEPELNLATAIREPSM